MKYSFSVLALAAFASAEFTSIFNITATPDQVVNAMNVSTPGQPGAVGQFNYAIDSKTNTICYDITLKGVSGVPQSPARTATHIHQGAKGKNGPPRIAFPNPVGDDNIRVSSGCLTGPFTTGLKMADNVTDTGAGFHVSQIEANPAGFFTDHHTNLFVPGVVRGQLDQSFKIIGDGSAITTATLTKTDVITITSCPPEKTDCPYHTQPLVTVTEHVYTTTCPVSELPHYTTPVVTKPVESPIYSVPGTLTIQPIYSTGAPVPTTSAPAVFTGAANVNAGKVGAVAAGLFAAALL